MDEDKKGGGGGGEGAGPLAKNALVAGLNGVRPKVQACYNQFKVPGTAMVTVVIGKSGKVTSATVTGKFAGTPTGTCVEAAVKTASFPPSDGFYDAVPVPVEVGPRRRPLDRRGAVVLTALERALGGVGPQRRRCR